MITLPGAGVRTMAALIATVPLLACDSGPSESQFVAACLREGQSGVNKGLGKAMGIDRDTFCRCSAKAAQTGLSDNGRRLMVWEMEGKRQEIAALQAKMSEAEKMDVMKAGFEVLGKCVRGG